VTSTAGSQDTFPSLASRPGIVTLLQENKGKASSGIPIHVAIMSLACNAGIPQKTYSEGKINKEIPEGDNRVTSL